MIVDDEKYAIEYVKMVLKDTEFQVIGESDDYERCIEEFEKKKPDLLILDLVMPEGIEHHEFIAKILDIKSDVNLVAITAVTDERVLGQIREYGVKKTLTKPLRPSELVNSLRSMMG